LGIIKNQGFMKNLNYTELRNASRTKVGSKNQIKAENEMIMRAGKYCTCIVSGLDHAMTILDNI
jgi:hypothetical protein